MFMPRYALVLLVLIFGIGADGRALSEEPGSEVKTARITKDNVAFIIVSTDWGTNSVTIDGVAYKRKHQVSKIGMPVLADTKHTVRVENSSSKATKTYEMTLEKGEARVILVELSGYDMKGGSSQPTRATPRAASKRSIAKAKEDPDSPAENIGFLTVNSVPVAQVYIDGKLVSSQTPLVKHKVAPGNHTVRVYYTDQKKFSETKRALITEGRHVNLYFQNRDQK